VEKNTWKYFEVYFKMALDRNINEGEVLSKTLLRLAFCEIEKFCKTLYIINNLK